MPQRSSRFLTALLACAGTLALAACGRDASAPLAPRAPTASLATTDAPSATTQWIVQMRGKLRSAALASRVAGLGGSVLFAHQPTGLAVVTGLSDNAAATLRGSSDVSSIERDESFQVDDVVQGDAVAADAGIASPGAPNTARIYSRQWDMRAIGADAAWAAGRVGSDAVTVAILDTGIDYTYPDLAGRVDLSRSISFVPSDDALVQQYFPGRNPITDLHYHGTHVAATVASNALVAAGVTSKVTLIGVKVLSVEGRGTLGAILAGVLWAADQGANVANLSLGGAFSKAGNGRFVGLINKSFNYAKSKGMLVVVAAGNDSSDLNADGNTYQTYCDTPNVVCVSATGPTGAASVNGPFYNVDTFASYSNFGSPVDVAAPGGLALPVWAGCSQTSLVIPICGTGTYIVGLSGTSMASPHVAGLAALLAEEYGRNPARIRARIQQTADDLGAPGSDPYYGKGRINVKAALGL